MLLCINHTVNYASDIHIVSTNRSPHWQMLRKQTIIVMVSIGFRQQQLLLVMAGKTALRIARGQLKGALPGSFVSIAPFREEMPFSPPRYAVHQA